MTAAGDPVAATVAAVLLKCLEQGLPVEIDGLGSFRTSVEGNIEFVPETRPRIFIAYVQEDQAGAERICEDLTANGFDAWLDKKRLLPGQNWPRCIERAIEVSEFFMPCFSRRGLGRRGHFHSELRYALDCARRVPVGEIFIVPVRLDDCVIPGRVARELQWVDLFPDWNRGFSRILTVLKQARRAAARRAA